MSFFSRPVALSPSDHALFSNLQVSQDPFRLPTEEMERREKMSRLLSALQESQDKAWATLSHFPATDDSPLNVERNLFDTDSSDSSSLTPSTQQSPSPSSAAPTNKSTVSSSSCSKEQSEELSDSLERAFSDLNREASEEFIFSTLDSNQAPAAGSTPDVSDQTRRIINLWIAFRPEDESGIIISGSPDSTRYDKGPQVGTGSFKRVFVATPERGSPTKKKIAVNYADTKNEEDSLAISREVEALKLCREKQIPGVLQLLDDDLQVGRFVKRFVTDYCNGGDLISWSRDKSLTSRLEILLGVAETFEALHSNGLAHGDLKSANIGIKRSRGRESSVVLDFGSFTKNGGKAESPHHFTQSYYPPIGGNRMNLSTPIQADVFCFGATLYEMTHQNVNPGALSKAVGKENAAAYSFSANQEDINRAIGLLPEIPEDVRNLLQSILKINPTERPTMQEVRSKLEAIIHENRGTITNCTTTV